ncbi:MAG TPA: sigma-70 family RNA polymerase sigma factor [Polyangiaceae bacterium]|nr:sigma-70 family RNA polymerase sigma factor [Polyangiaceae bacterium]
MAGATREGLECEIRDKHEQGQYAAAAALVIRGYGAELFGFLLAFHRDEEDAAEVFAEFSERLVRALPAFRGGSSFRTWAYALARHASLNYRRGARRRDKRQMPLPDGSEHPAVVELTRDETPAYLRTDRRARFTALRESLPREDQELLVLRVDRGLSWNDLALVRHDGASALTDEALKREAMRLRQRFHLLKKRLSALARDAGVLDDRPEGG